jgi:hypothetical protein
MADAICPVCGKAYAVPDGRGREMVVTKFLAHKDACELPREDEFVKVGGRIGVVIETQESMARYPLYEVQMPSGRSNTFHASEVHRIEDQEDGRRRFYE